MGGPAPYWKSYTFDLTGNRTSFTSRATAGNTVSTYAYPVAGAARPHGVTGVTTTGPGGTTSNTYGYDASGDTTTRALAGQASQTLAWDAEGQLTSQTSTSTGTTSYVYAATGTRILKREPGAVTLYLANGTQLRRDTATNAVASTRYYSHAGQVVAVRTGGVVSTLITDPHGTAELAINNSNNAVTQRRLDPFGLTRGTAPAWPGDRGFVGGIIDTTGLTRLGAREYDASLGRFLSVDPLLNLGDPQSMNGYAYGNNSPVTFSDPSGLMIPYEPDSIPELLSDDPAPAPVTQKKSCSWICQLGHGVDNVNGFRGEVKKGVSNAGIYTINGALNWLPAGCLPSMLGVPSVGDLVGNIPSFDCDTIECKGGGGEVAGYIGLSVIPFGGPAVAAANGSSLVARFLAKVRGFKPKAPPAPSTGDVLTSLAGKAQANVGNGSGAVHGTKVHSEFARQVNKLGRSDLQTEVTYLNGKVVPYGTSGAVRLDVVEGNVLSPTAIYDLKTGSAALTKARIADIYDNLPVGSQNIPVLEIRP